MAPERLQKILAELGYGSRRSCELIIGAGRVRVNQAVAQIGMKADIEKDTILVDNQPVPKPPPAVYIAVNKPPEVLSDIEPKNDPRKTVRDLVDIPGHLFCVGRLDFDSEGLILLTNDGELANTLTHPRYGHEKEYRVLLANRPDEKQLEAWRHGVVLEDGHRTAPASVRLENQAGKGSWMRVVMKEGHKRQIREICKQIGLGVTRLIRLRIGTLELGSLKPGEWRYLTHNEIRSLKASRGTSTQSLQKSPRKDRNQKK
jgi:23S rRNA pseudouridine2605 synthase